MICDSIRRTIKPALGSTQVRKVRGPLLDTLYARLMRCGTKTWPVTHMRPRLGDPGRDHDGAGGRWCALAPSAFLFSNDPAHSRPWNPDWVTHRVCDLAKAAGVDLDIKGIRPVSEVDRRAAAYLVEKEHLVQV